MAISTRIDNCTAGPQGQLNFTVTEGSAPLPALPSGDGVSFASAQELREQADAFELGITTQQRLFILVSQHMKDVPNFTAESLAAACNGTTVTIALSSPSGAITIG